MIKKIFGIMLCFTLLLISGCYNSNNYPAFREQTVKCIENDEDTFTSLYNLCRNNDIVQIERTNKDEKADNELIFEYNNYKYNIRISDNNSPMPSTDICQQLCFLADNLMSKYPIQSINYFTIIKKMEIWFNEDFIDTDWGIIYYPLDIIPQKDVEDKEKSEEIKDGFFTYIWFKG